MPDISKINALAIGSVAKVDGLAKASILDIDGVAVPSAFTGLLDTYTGAAAGYSVRQLKGGITISMRVRRETAGGAGDDDEADVAFDTSLATPTISLDSAISNASAGVTATTLGQFLNVGTVGGTTYTNPDSLTVTASCFVDEWKDQSGNANHATQGTFGIQPQIHSGTVNTDLITENGKPAVKFFWETGNLNKMAMTSEESIQFFTHSMVYNQNDATRFNFMSSGGLVNYYRLETNGLMYLIKSGDFDSAAGAIGTPGYALRILIRDTSSTATAYVDGSSSNAWTALDSSNFRFIAIDANYSGAAAGRYVNHQEFIIWSDAKNSTDRGGIETDQNTYFSIF